MYAVGPSTLERDDRLIPLNNLPLITGPKRNVASLLTKFDDNLLEHLMGARLHHHESTTVTEAGQTDEKADPVEPAPEPRQVKPLRATYIGMCLSPMPMHFRNFRKSDGSLVTDERTKWNIRRQFAKQRVEACKRADEDEGPPPHVIDIV